MKKTILLFSLFFVCELAYCQVNENKEKASIAMELGKFDIALSYLEVIPENQQDDKIKSMKTICTDSIVTRTLVVCNQLLKVQKYEEALAQENVIALSIATRPDCLDEDVLDLLIQNSSKVSKENELVNIVVKTVSENKYIDPVSIVLKNYSTSNSKNSGVKEENNDGNKDGNGSDTKEDTTTKKFKYLYSCPSTTTYWSSWSDWSTTKVSANSNRQVETKNNTTQTRVITGYKTVSKFAYYETVYTENKTEYTSVKAIPKDVLSTCDNGVQKKGPTGFYYVYTCTEKVASQVPHYTYTQEPIYGYTSSNVTLYRYRTRSTSTKSSDVWSDLEKDTSLINKGCTILRSELVTTTK